MIDKGDWMTTVLLRELQWAEDADVRIVAVTTLSSLVAALAANQLGARLAIATGFGTLDSPARPTLTLGDARLGAGESPVGPWSDTFAALARGMVGVFTTPAQLDARGATNLSRVGGSNDAPKVALPGSRGLPDNNDSPSRVWYLFSNHSPRTLVERVDFQSGPPPSSDRVRRMITPLGVFQLEGMWRAESLFPGVTTDDVTSATGFAVSFDGFGEIDEPNGDELAALRAVDPYGLARIEFMDDPSERIAEVTCQERS